MNKRLKEALKDAVELQYAWVPDPEDLDYEYIFSDSFETSMKKIIAGAGRTYVSIGRRRIRKSLLAALIAALILAMTAGAIAVQYAVVHWNEAKNEKDGTIDVSFFVEDPNQQVGEFQFKKPKTPEGYEIILEEKYSSTEYHLEYQGRQGEIILYSQSGSVETMGFALDYEDADVQEVDINGQKGYAYSKLGNQVLVWSDGIALYDICGTCDFEILWQMAESLNQNTNR